MKYSICRAMTELKTLKARYQKEVLESKLIAVKQGTKLRGGYSSYKEDSFLDQAKSTIQSIDALEARILMIKTAIDKSNSETTVVIGKKTMTVQEALAMKSIMELKHVRLDNMKRQMSIARREYEAALDDNRKRIEKTVQDQTASGQKDPEMEKNVLESIEKIYKVEFVDASGLDGKIESLEKEIEDFESNVDYALSESNSTTFIEIPD